MIREFFGARPFTSRTCVAWTGLLFFVGHAVFKAFIKASLNNWYARFFDTVQWREESPMNDNATIHTEHDDMLSVIVEGKRTEVWLLLWEFASIVAPILVVSPTGRYLSSRWRFEWRMALVHAYLAHYDTSQLAIEGMAQRVHEDTMRFEEGVYTCVSVGLDAFLALIVFVPVLVEAGTDAHPVDLDWPPWLLAVAVLSSTAGLITSMLVGRKLVGLEVANQKAEAHFRTKLVVLEQHTVGTSLADGYCPDLGVPAYFVRCISSLRSNYGRLFLNFAAFDTWISAYDQTMTLLPYMLIAPMLFAPRVEDRVTLGALMRVTNAFKEVFGALSTLTDNWAAVNSFRSTIRRLSEFEKHVYGAQTFDSQRLVDATHDSQHMVSSTECVEIPLN
jgi:putative ATP-binding cassette transporter